MNILQVTQSPQPIISNWTIIAACAAVLSAISAFRSSRFAKRALAIAGQTYKDRQANFSIYLIDGYRLIAKKEEKKKILLFHITINNKSDSKNSFKAELEIEYIRTDQSVARAIVNHNENLGSNVANKSFSFFSNDIRVDEKGMQSKWLLFEEPENVFKQCRIEKYSIKISDTQNNTQSVDAIIIKELSNV